MATRRFSADVMSAINNAAAVYRLPVSTMQAIAQVESGGNPRAQTGSYGGLFQLSPSEFKRGGGTGNILDPSQNAMAAGRLFSGFSQAFQDKYGQAPTASQLYMIHQQGWGGYEAHSSNPSGLAWQNMASTAEGQQKDAKGPIYKLRDGTMGVWSQAAIDRNILRGSGLSWQTATSQDFQDMWQNRLARAGAGVPAGVVQQAADSGGTSIGDAYASGATDTNSDLSQPVGKRGLGEMSPAELTAIAPPKTSPFEAVTGLTPNMDVINNSIPAPVVQGVDANAGASMGSIFGGGGGGIGAALSAAGRAIAGAGPKVPSFPDPATQMAALDSRDPWPSIPSRPRRAFRPG